MKSSWYAVDKHHPLEVQKATGHRTSGPYPARAWTHQGSVFDDKFVGQPSGPESQDVSGQQLHGHILNVALIDKGAVSGIEVLENKAVLGLIIFNKCMMVVDVCRLKYRRKTAVARAPTSTREYGYQKVLSPFPGRLVTTTLIQKR